MRILVLAIRLSLFEKIAQRLLPIADEYEMMALKSSCEKVLVAILKTTSWAAPKREQPARKFERKGTESRRLLDCLLSSDRGKSLVLLEECIKIYSDPDVSVKEVKSCMELSDQVKAKIYENRMDAASLKLHKLSTELEREKQENEHFKNNMADNKNSNRNKSRPEGRPNRFGQGQSKQPPKPAPSNDMPVKARPYGTRQRYDNSIKGSNQDLTRNSRAIGPK